MTTAVLRTLSAAVKTCLLLATALGVALPTASLAQTNAAAMAVRRQVDDVYGGGQEAPPPETNRRQQPPTRSRAAARRAPAGRRVDLSYVPADAVAIAVLRPAKCLDSPLARLLPVEVASAYGIKYTGFDPSGIDEIVAFAQFPATGPAAGVVARFKEPYKGSAIPASLRKDAKLAKLDNRNYLQAQSPTGFSFYGPDNKTLVAAPDDTLRQAVTTKDQPKTSPLIERVRAARPGGDLYIAVDVAAIRPIIEPMLAMARMQAQQAPPDAQEIFEIPNLLTAAELTLDLSAANPATLVLHANDDASAERLESLVQKAIQLQQAQLQAQLAQAAAGDDPIATAMAQYSQRVSGQWAPRREGSTLTFLESNPSEAREKQLVLAATIGYLVGKATAQIPSDPKSSFDSPDAPGAPGAPQDSPRIPRNR